MYLVNINVRLDGITYAKGEIIESIPDEKFAHCFTKLEAEKDHQKRETRGRKSKK